MRPCVTSTNIFKTTSKPLQNRFKTSWQAGCAFTSHTGKPFPNPLPNMAVHHFLSPPKPLPAGRGPRIHPRPVVLRATDDTPSQQEKPRTLFLKSQTGKSRLLILRKISQGNFSGVRKSPGKIFPWQFHNGMPARSSKKIGESWGPDPSGPRFAHCGTNLNP